MPTPGIPSKAEMLRFALFMGILIPVKPSKRLSITREKMPGMADFNVLDMGRLYFKIKCIESNASITEIFCKASCKTTKELKFCNFFTYDILSNLILFIKYL